MAETVDATPVYMRIRRCIEERIERGAYPTGSMIPSEKDLAEEFGTTRLTIRSAVDELVRRGQIRRVRGKGAFVAQKVPAFFERTVGFRESVRAGRTSRPSVFSRVPSVMRGHYADLFGIAEDDLLYSVRRLNCINGSPVSIETALIPCLLFPTIEDIDVSVFSLYETYEMLGRKPVMAQEKLDIEALGARDAGLLGLEQGDLVLLLECVSYARAVRLSSM
ncbi:MAG: GntR family transcriptional regulator [Collinsella sp.]